MSTSSDPLVTELAELVLVMEPSLCLFNNLSNATGSVATNSGPFPLPLVLCLIDLGSATTSFSFPFPFEAATFSFSRSASR